LAILQATHHAPGAHARTHTQESELTFLLEGQKSSIDAIRLKEQLQPPLLERKLPKPLKPLSRVERQRVSDLLRDG
jgi:hypothetical protein